MHNVLLAHQDYYKRVGDCQFCLVPKGLNILNNTFLDMISCIRSITGKIQAPQKNTFPIQNNAPELHGFSKMKQCTMSHFMNICEHVGVCPVRKQYQCPQCLLATSAMSNDVMMCHLQLCKSDKIESPNSHISHPYLFSHFRLCILVM